MALQYDIRQSVYYALTDTLLDRFGEEVTDRFGEPVTRRDAIGLDGVYDVAPQADDPALPLTYSVIGTRITRPMDTKTTRGYTTLLRIYTYSRSTSVRAIEDAQDRIFDTLHYRKHDFALIVDRQSSDILLGPDSRHYGVCEYLFTMLDI